MEIQNEKEQIRLYNAAEDLIAIIDGARAERWADGRYRRLTDTLEWCRFYVAFNALKRTQKQG